jgi:phospholipase/lecithinase/hemolysin
MFKQVFYRIILLVFLSTSGSALANENFSNIYIFGDSLSDNGNLAEFPQAAFLTNPLLPYDQGFSNGLRAVEVLAEALGLAAEPSKHLTSPIGPVGTNFAVAGARTVTLGVAPTIDLPTQINAFFFSMGGVAPSDALYVVFIGGNDIRDARDTYDPHIAADIITEAAVGVADALKDLVSIGAQHILVVNAADIGAIPETNMLAEALGDAGLIKRATRLTKMFNKRVKKAVHRIEHEFDLDIIQFNGFRFFQSILKHSEELGFTNNEDACFFTETLLTTGVPVYHPDCGFFDFDSFVFFDEIHLTAQTHLLIGQAMAEVVMEEFEVEDDDDDHEEDDD